jgi:hypothetical protein
VTWRAHRAFVAVALAAALVAGAAVTSPARAASRPLVLVYGDSLVYEARPYADGILGDVARVDHQVVGLPGGAACDLLPQMRADAARLAPVLVVLAFSGNSQTDCMKDAQGNLMYGDALVAKYRADTVAAVIAFRRTAPPIWLATAPISLLSEKQGDDGDRRMAAMLHGLAAQNRRVHVTEAGAAVLDHGWWTRTLPCLPNEPCTGGVDSQGRRVNVVRAPDGAHFCPVAYPKLHDCPTYASGGLRYALGFLVAPLRSLRLYDEGRAGDSLGAGWTG